ncbi:MAG: guanine deaminase [Epulopiscium sp. Nuni2H_MBin003]|nr:MAG: guanine deaminase [Epulopiscium sp. Nuni2H_MBin003]
MTFALKGNICHTPDKKIEIYENSYLIVKDTKVVGIFEDIPQQFKDIEVKDYGKNLILPGLTDLHVHAPQYTFAGLGMDLELLDWLNTHTFVEEANYSNLEYANKAYEIFTNDLKYSATTRACIFATLHTPATKVLMDKLEQTGLITFVGKVNMDRNSPDTLIEETNESIEETTKWLELIDGKYKYTKPILTPRFIPSCTDELMTKLKEIRDKYDLPVQSHLSENPSEIEWVKELCPTSSSYADAYRQFGMLSGSIMAHCVHSDEDEQQMLKEQNVFVAHSPQSNIGLSSGIAPVRQMLDKDINVGLASDVAGGYSISIFKAMADAIQVSKLRWRLINSDEKALSIAEAFYLGTKGGGAFFGKVGSFEEDYDADILVIDDAKLNVIREFTVSQRIERLIYMSEVVDIKSKYVAGRCIF